MECGADEGEKHGWIFWILNAARGEHHSIEMCSLLVHAPEVFQLDEETYKHILLHVKSAAEAQAACVCDFDDPGRQCHPRQSRDA